MERRAVSRNRKPIDLTAVEFDLLEVLMKVAGTVVKREDLVRTVNRVLARPEETR
jgi:DNA-binding response OmpR family regulator